jgi:Flp pilus assembly protein TadD
MFAPRALLGSAFLAKREPTRATAVFSRLVELAPKDARAHYMLGVALRAQGKAIEARKALETAVAIAPDYTEPMTELVSMALAERQPDAAVRRVKAQIALVPGSAGLQELLGVIHASMDERAGAESAFLAAIKLEPTGVGAYVRLGELYGSSGRYDEALLKLNEAIRLSPRDLPTRMLAAVVHERKGNLTRAQEAYEQILGLDSRFAPAANNLAWLYSEHGGDKNKALALAQTAREVAPDDPRIADTLGWILYRRGLYQSALGLLTESAAKLPGDPVIQYHLGMTSLRLGKKDDARRALTAAVGSGMAFGGRDDAAKALTGID